MPEPSEPNQRRRARRRATAQQGPPAARVDEPPKAQPKQGRRRDPKGRGRAAAPQRADHDLAGTVSSQIVPTGAMRARDLNRPTPEDLAQAEAELVIVRRHWDPAAHDQRPSGRQP